uniref:RB binding protein 5, histone lysine methyltransferase complex subunit n=1 Tax=Molossus molossus TaxID=27622 RepID=A0A7J8CTI1_MOLMO|nr:RB binding protein 5, histone lysine methyltransferase complex subunit [Molossus molossus]
MPACVLLRRPQPLGLAPRDRARQCGLQGKAHHLDHWMKADSLTVLGVKAPSGQSCPPEPVSSEDGRPRPR